MKKVTFALIVLLLSSVLSFANEISDAQNKLLAKRAAEADCYRKLAERIMGLKINSSTLVRDFVTESDEIQTEVNTFIKGIRLGKPRWYDDGSCEVKGEVTYEKVVATLKKIYDRHYKGDNIKASDFEQMITRKHRSIISAVGMGAPRPDTPVDIPDGTVDTPAPASLPTYHIPALWRKIGPQGRLLAKRAAELDAYRRLAEQLRGFKITSNTYVKDFVTQSDEINTELNTTLRGAKEVKVYFHDDEPICEVTLEIPWRKVIATIRESYTRHFKDGKLKASDFKEITTRVEKKYFRATGMGIPPARFLNRAKSAMKITPPDWMNRPISAVGQAPIMKDKPLAQAKLLAARAAELDAKRKLAERINGLTISSETTVKDFVTENDEIRSEMMSTLAGAYVKETQFSDDMATVTVEIPGFRVWSVLADELKLKEKH